MPKPDVARPARSLFASVILCILLASSACGPAAGEPSDTVGGTLTVDGVPIPMTEITFQDAGSSVLVTVSDRPAPSDVGMASYAEQGISAISFGFEKEPFRLHEALGVTIAHPDLPMASVRGVELSGGAVEEGVYEIALGLEASEQGGSTVSLQVDARLDLAALPECDRRTGTIEGADADPAKTLAAFYRSLLQCDLEAARDFLTEGGKEAWDGEPEAELTRIANGLPEHIAVKEVQGRDDETANVLLQTVPDTGTTVGISMQRIDGQWLLDEEWFFIGGF